jgi:hypothetical protein
MALGAAGTIAGCTEIDNSQNTSTPSSDDTDGPESNITTEPTSTESSNIDGGTPQSIPLAVEEFSVADGESAVNIGDKVAVEMILTVPVSDGLYDAIVDVSFIDETGAVVTTTSDTFGGTADGDSMTLQHSVELSTGEFDSGEYMVRVVIEDYPSGETTTVERDLELLNPLAEDRAAIEDHLEAVREMIQEAVETFQSRGNGSLTGVTAEDTETSLNGITGATASASAELNEARSYDIEEYHDEIDRLEVEQRLTRQLVYAQRHAFDVINRFRTVLDGFADEKRAIDALEIYTEEVTDFDRRINFGESSISNLVSDATNGEEEAADYGAKIEQFNGEIDTFAELDTISVDTQDAVRDLIEARDSLESEEYTDAQLSAENARYKFGNITDDLSAVDRLPETTGRFVEICNEHATAARNVRREAIEKAGEDDNS